LLVGRAFGAPGTLGALDGGWRVPQLPLRPRDLPPDRFSSVLGFVRGGRPARRSMPFPGAELTQNVRTGTSYRASGASKSSAIWTRPSQPPGSRREARPWSGVNRASGRPALAMMISSPAAARSTRADSCDLASYRLTNLLTISTGTPALELVNLDQALRLSPSGAILSQGSILPHRPTAVH